MLTRSAWKSLERHLNGRLRFSLSSALHLEEIAIRAIAHSRGRNRPNAELAQELIRDFPGSLEVIARLMSSWLEAQRELLSRLSRDQTAIQKKFFRTVATLRVVSIRPGMSDPHDRGRSVTLIEFTGRRRVVYKPRPCCGEQIWYEGLSWLGLNGTGCWFRRPGILPRKNYAWMEFLPVRGCASSNSVHGFYFRWGAQSALAQVLGVCDLHRENWIALGSHPVLVDAEMMGAAKSNRGERRPIDSRMARAFLNTGLIPLTARDGVGRYRAVAPFDMMSFGRPPTHCWPRYKGRLQAPARYVDDLVNGFEAAARVLEKPALGKSFFNQVLLPLPSVRVRRLLRATAEYAGILRDSLDATKMISSAERWRWLKQECCATVATRRIAHAEAVALRRCDIPRFTGSARSLSWPQFCTAVAELKCSARVLRRRVLLVSRGG